MIHVSIYQIIELIMGLHSTKSTQNYGRQRFVHTQAYWCIRLAGASRAPIVLNRSKERT